MREASRLGPLWAGAAGGDSLVPERQQCVEKDFLSLPMALQSEWTLGAGLELRQYTHSSPQGTCLKLLGCSFAAE